MSLRLCRDAAGTPGILAESSIDAYRGLGFLHGKFRGRQVGLLMAAAFGELSLTLLPFGALRAIDHQARRWQLRARGEAEGRLLDDFTQAHLTAYVSGLNEARKPSWPHLWPSATPERILSALLLSSYLSQASGQERMELAIVEALQAGAFPHVLERLFAPHLSGWDPEALRRVRLSLSGQTSEQTGALSGGSNAWAVGGERTESGFPMLCGDPHLPVQTLPAVFFEARVRFGNNYWLGATIPGLPGIAVGRNRDVAWAATFGCADNIDLRVSENGLSAQWAGGDKASESLSAYMRLPLARSAAEAQTILSRAHALSLHYVLADRAGDVRHVQAGRVPCRSAGWSGLFPASRESQRWCGFREGSLSGLPHGQATVVIAANQASTANDGTAIATLPQPNYRYQRIAELLAKTEQHTVGTMQAIQRDTLSLRAKRLWPALRALGAIEPTLKSWDYRYEVDSTSAPRFEAALEAALSALAPFLGGAWFRRALRDTMVPLWWANALDGLLATLQPGEPLAEAVRYALAEPRTLSGQERRFSFGDMIFGPLAQVRRDIPTSCALPGSLATPRQGTIVRVDGQAQVLAPAYAFISDLGEDRAFTALAGGISDAPWSGTYAHWLQDWKESRYHVVAPPTETESI